MFNIKGKVAIVTGGNGGIGLGMAHGLAKAGANIVIAARNKEKSRAAVLDLQALGSEALAIEVDVRDEQSVADMVSETNRRYGKMDILINNAGMSIRKPVQDLALEEWRQVLDTNLTSAFLCSRAAYPYMKQNGGGKIINIGSMLSVFGSPYAPAYSSSKGGIVQLTKSMATAWAVDAIQVNAILPGWIDTELTQQARQAVCGLNERVIARTPAGKWGSADDLAGVAVFLASSASDFITGAAIPVDGGYSALA
ncbi:glucose 1-dehydrogenase [bacterium]|nr:glucose 1-dehydrogenase [bacterium]